MDPKEIKSLLKQAKEAIKNKEYNAALKYCKSVLNGDKLNYNAWVFVGVAAQETLQFSQAEEAFQRAIDINPDQQLAYQGICNFYEKQGKDEKLFDVLSEKLEVLYTDKAKLQETAEKLYNISKTICDKEKIIVALTLKLNYLENDQKAEFEIFREMFEVVCQGIGEKFDKLKIPTMVKLVEHEAFSEKDCDLVNSLFIKSLCENGSASGCMEVMKHVSASKYSGKFLGFIITSFLSNYMKYGEIAEGLEKLIDLAESITIQDYLYYTFKGLLQFASKQYVLAIECLHKALGDNSSSLETYYILIKIQLCLHQNREAENSTKSALKLAMKSNAPSYVIGNLYLFLGEALAGNQSWEASFKAYEKCVEFLGRKADVLKSFCFTLLEVGHVQEAQKMYAELCSILDDNPAVMLQLEGYMHLLRKEYPVALQKLRKCLSHEESAFTLHLIGKILWETEEYEKSVKIFVKAAEMDPYFSRNFLFLGHYYSKFSSDKRKARQCYQKAFDLDAGSEEVCMSLSSILKDIGENDEYVTLLTKITKEAPMGKYFNRCKWAWTQLGLYQLQADLISDAIFSLQNVVRADPHSSYAWECLGDAYLKRGSYESALKAFEKASELNPSSMYPLYQVSTIQKARGMYEDSVVRYKKLLEVAPTYIPAQIGLAETFILLGRKSYNECLFGRARDCFQETLNILSKVLHSRSSLRSLWKLAGDACTLASQLGQKWLPLDFPPEFNIPNLQSSSKESLLCAGARFYGQALSLEENLSSLWHDLGVNYLLQSYIRKDNQNEDVSKKAFICLQKAVSMAPDNHCYWVSLGIVSVSSGIQDYALGQHAFLKSIAIERNNVEAWTNLGILYLEKDNIDLAHQAFKVAQSLDPSYPLCWIGQAIIAHKVKHSETMDLFRHATTLGSHAEVLVGYGQAVCHALLDTSQHKTELYKYNIEQMDAVVVASDCLVKYAANHENSPKAFNSLGMLLERQKLYQSALYAYKCALDLLEDNDEIEEIRSNYARLLSLTGSYTEAIAEYMKLKKIGTSLLCSFALVLFKNKDFEKSYQVFSRALSTCEDAGMKAHIQVAMAMVLWKLPATEGDKAQHLLIESSQAKPPSIPGLLALWACGILNKNVSLTAAVGKEIAPYKLLSEYSSSISSLTAIQAFVENGFRSGRSSLCESMHSQPNNADIWMHAAFNLLHWETSNAQSVVKLSNISVFHGGDQERDAQIYALSQLAMGCKKDALSAAQKAVHIHPDKLANWITLTASCHFAKKHRRHIGWIFKFVKNLAKEQGIKTDVLGWLVIMEIAHNIRSGDFASASKLMKQVLSFTSFESQIQSTIQILNAFIEVLSGRKLDALVMAVSSNSANFLGWQLLVRLLVHQEKYVEAEKTLQKFVLTSSRNFPKLHVYPLLQIAAISYKLMQVSADKEKWLKTGEEAITEAIKNFPNNFAARFLQGLFAFETGNTNLARRSLEKVIFNNFMKECLWMKDIGTKILISVYLKKKDVDALKRLLEQFTDNQDIKSAIASLIEEND